MRKMSPSSWEKERAMVLRGAASKGQCMACRQTCGGKPKECWTRGHQGHVRLGSAAIGLPVAVELCVGHCQVETAVSGRL